MVIKYNQDNGLRVLLEPIDAVVSASIGLWIRTGSRHENDAQYGYAHFVEHMLFKGTSEHSARDIARIVDRVGGQHNAATNREYTCYYINVVSEHIELAIRVLADMYYNSLFDKSELEKEKNVIMEEIRMYEDTPDEFIHDLFMESMLHGHPLSHSILGTLDSIKETTRDRLVSFFHDHYCNENALFVIAGKFDEGTTRQLVEKYFPRNCGTPAVQVAPEAPAPQRIIRKHVERDLEQVHFCLGIDGLTRDHEDRWPLYTLSTILGGNMSSRLFQNIREKEGISYSIYSFHSSFFDTGVFGIYCATSPDTYCKAVELIIKECRDMLVSGVTDEELDDAKTYMKGNLALSMESVEVRMGQLAKNEMTYGRSFTFDDMVECINRITRDDYDRVCRRIFEEKKLSLMSVGNADKAVETIEFTI